MLNKVSKAIARELSELLGDEADLVGKKSVAKGAEESTKASPRSKKKVALEAKKRDKNITAEEANELKKLEKEDKDLYTKSKVNISQGTKEGKKKAKALKTGDTLQSTKTGEVIDVKEGMTIDDIPEDFGNYVVNPTKNQILANQRNAEARKRLKLMNKGGSVTTKPRKGHADYRKTGLFYKPKKGKK